MVDGWTETSASPEEARYRALILRGSAAGLIAHASFLVAFIALGARALAWFNVGSIALFAGCMWLARRRRERLATSLIQLEVLSHAALAVWYLGWDSGFHYYVFCLVPLAVGLPAGGTAPRVLFLAFCTATYLALDFSGALVAPIMELGPETLRAIRAFNVVGAMAILGYLLLWFRLAIVHAEDQLASIARTDLLSGLHTRRHGVELVTREFERASRSGRALSLMLADIDNFKPINDRYGHNVGDQVIAAASERLRAGVRKADMVARWGGEEFLVILPESDGLAARAVVERVQKSISAVPIRVGDLDIHVTMTCGVAEYVHGESVDHCMQRVDAALYEGKRRGRNQVVVAPSLPVRGAPVSAGTRTPAVDGAEPARGDGPSSVS